MEKWENVAEIESSIVSLVERKPELQFAIGKAMFRRGNVDVINSVSDTDISDCLATCDGPYQSFFLGIDCLQQMNFTSAKNWAKQCFDSRKHFLGEKHLDTCRAQFMLGFVEVSSTLGQTPILPNDVKYMTDALDVFERNAETNFWFYPDMLRKFAQFRSNEGMFDEAENYFKKAISVETELKNDPKCASAALHFFDLGDLYFQFQKWKCVLDTCVPAVSGFTEFDPNENLIIGDVLGLIAYSYFKTGQFKLADQYFKKAISKIDSCSSEKPDGWSSVKAKIVGFKMEFEYFAMKRKKVAEKDFKLAEKLVTDTRNNGTFFYEPKGYFQLGLCYEFVKKDFKEAFRNYGCSLRGVFLKLQKTHPQHCDCILALGRIILKQTKNESGEDFVKEAFKHACQLVGPNDAYMKPIFEVLQGCVDAQKQLTNANKKFQMFMKCFEDEKISQSSHFVASFVLDFGRRLYNDKCAIIGLKGCERLFEKSFEVFQKVFGTGDKKTAESQRMMGLCCLKKGDLKKAEWYLLGSAVVLVQYFQWFFFCFVLNWCWVIKSLLVLASLRWLELLFKIFIKVQVSFEMCATLMRTMRRIDATYSQPPVLSISISLWQLFLDVQ